MAEVVVAKTGPTDHESSFWSQPVEQVLGELESDRGGLSATQAVQRLRLHGPNELPTAAPEPLWKRIARQFDNILIYILLISGGLKAILGDWVDVVVIVAVTIINAAIGFIQEGKAEGALSAIRTMLAPTATALRDGQWVNLAASDLVPGDVVRVRSGDLIPGDLRILSATNLSIDESALTGESVAAAKQSGPVAATAGLGDLASMAYSGTLVATGQGTAVVTATGDRTEIGRIQHLVHEVSQVETPLTRQLNQLGKVLAIMILAMALVMIIVAEIFHDFTSAELLSATIGFAVAAVPEGLAALVTVTLALGVQQMAKRRAISRRLPAVETLGSVTTICSDKTGTLTKNEMTVRTVRTYGRDYDVTGVGYAPQGQVNWTASEFDDPGPDLPVVANVPGHADLVALATVVSLCNDATISSDGKLVGEPTEGALQSFALKSQVDLSGWSRVALIPFESVNKFMVTLDQSPGGDKFVHVKGEPDRILRHCATQLNADGTASVLDREYWLDQIDQLSLGGLRVLAAARQPRAHDMGNELVAREITDLELCGLIGIVDPPRPEAVAAIAECKTAGITVKMITGDHAGTALAISRELGLINSLEAPVLTGPELEAMTTEQLKAVVRDVHVFARTSPEHKIRVVSALQSHGEVVAMTGDGVNDAPALTQADVGVAMGIKGTDATKAAADVVLADDNFATIEKAVEEGRRTYDNIRKSVLFLLPTNGAQSLVILVAIMFGLTLPLQPVQVLWINMISAVTLSLALAYEPAEHNIMTRAPRDVNAKLVDGSAILQILFVSVLIGGATLAVFVTEYGSGASLGQAQTAAVTMLALAQLAYLLSCRFLTESSLTLDVLRGNRIIWVSGLSLLALQAAYVYLPFMNTWFGSAPIGAGKWLTMVLIATGVFLIAEAAKWVGRRRARVGA